MNSYFHNLSVGRAVLWCYVIWYGVMVGFYFQPVAELWINSVGLSLIVGFALVLATGPLSKRRFIEQRWAIFRLFLCPFCVSSFSALTSSHGFYMLFSSSLKENLTAIASCTCFLLLVLVARKVRSPGCL